MDIVPKLCISQVARWGLASLGLHTMISEALRITALYFFFVCLVAEMGKKSPIVKCDLMG
jgi:hypothetical protein